MQACLFEFRCFFDVDCEIVGMSAAPPSDLRYSAICLIAGHVITLCLVSCYTC